MTDNNPLNGNFVKRAKGHCIKTIHNRCFTENVPVKDCSECDDRVGFHRLDHHDNTKTILVAR